MRVILTPEQLAKLIRFADDDREAPDIEAIEALNVLHETVQRNALRHLSGALKRNARLSDRLERYQEKRRAEYATGEFQNVELDSVTVAKALLYQLQQRMSYGITTKRFQAILFRIYATWLYKNKERLFDEQPKAQEYGAVFFRVKNNLQLSYRAVYADYKALCEADPDRAAFVKSSAEYYANKTEDEILSPILKGSAYKNASKEHNDGKWSKTLSDADIYAWRETLDPKKQ